MYGIILYWTEVTYWASYQHMTEHDAQPKTNVKKPEKEEGHTLFLIFKKTNKTALIEISTAWQVYWDYKNTIEE